MSPERTSNGGRMHSTGLEALDSRLGGVRRGGMVLIVGEAGVGKSVLGMHFLIDGLDHRERCLLVTRDRTDDIDARGLFVGFSPGALSEHPTLERLDPAGAGAELGAAAQRDPRVEGLRQVADAGDRPVSRMVIDDLNAFLRGTHSPLSSARALARYLSESGITTYVMVSTADVVGLDHDVVDLFRNVADVVLELEQTGRGRRRLAFRTVRQASFSTDPFLYTLRSGGGFAEDLPAYDRVVDASLRKRIVILDEVGVLPPEVATALRGKFELEIFQDLSGSLQKLLAARYGVLVLSIDPYDPERTFNVAYTLRQAGNGVPILFISHSKGLRSTTRARALRIGGDDFLIAELPPQEIVERITITAERGHHRRNGSVRPDRPMQPKTEDGSLRAMTAAELAGAVDELVGEAPTPFFAVAVFDTGGEIPADMLWESLGPQIRLNDGDLLGVLDDRRIAVLLNQVDVSLSRRVLSRLRRSHSALAQAPEPSILTSPLQSDELRSWIAELQLRRAR